MRLGAQTGWWHPAIDCRDAPGKNFHDKTKLEHSEAWDW